MAFPERRNHRIHVVLDNKDYGIRYWANVPRKGDLIMLKEQKIIGKNNHFTAKVTQVTWGVAVDDYKMEWPDVNLHCTRTKLPVQG